MTNTTLTKKHATPSHQTVAILPTTNKHSTQPHNKKAGPKTTIKEPSSSHSKPGPKPKTNKKQRMVVNSDGETTDAHTTNKQKVKKQVKSPSAAISNPTQATSTNKQAQHHQQQQLNSHQHQQQQHHNHQHHQQQRRNVLPVKVRRMERRKDIESMTEALQTSQADLLSSSPPISATESEDSDPGRMEQKKRSQGNNKIKKKPNVDNAATFPPLNQSKKSTPRRQQQPQQQQQQHHQGNKIVYAGPTFNNAPAPSALPIPALSSGSQSSSSTTQHDEVFYMEVIPPRPVQQPDFQQQSRDLMNLLAPRRTAPVIHHPHPHHHYQLPPSGPMMPMMPMMNLPQRGHTLSQIQSDLRSMLKLEAAS